jgi:hypothetical protein
VADLKEGRDVSEDRIEITASQTDRKTRSEARLNEAGVRVNEWLPVIEDESQMALRSPSEVADRLVALTVVAAKGQGLDQSVVEEIAKDLDARRRLSPNETAFIDDPDPSQHDRIQFVWRYEAAWIMLWALKLVDEPLSNATAICDVPRLCGIVRDEPDLTKNGLRTIAEIADEADLIYRRHWATRQSSLDGIPPGGGLEPGVVMERHYALNWLIGTYGDCGWDDVGTDT